MTTEKEHKGHIEFRKEGSHKFYAPDRDLLHCYTPLVKSALKEAADTCSDESYKTFKYLVDGVVSVHNNALTEDTPENIVANALADMGKANPEVLTYFMMALTKQLFVMYIAALRDSVEKPIFNEREIQTALRSTSILALIPEEQRENVKLELQRALGVTEYAADSGMYAKVTDVNDGNDA